MAGLANSLSPTENATSILDVYALNCLQNKPKNLHESISFRYDFLQVKASFINNLLGKTNS